MRGEARAGLGEVESALADWRRALELEPEDIGPLYSTAFLLEGERRRAEAAEVWRSIIEWNESRGYALESEWPQQELNRLETECAATDGCCAIRAGACAVGVDFWPCRVDARARSSARSSRRQRGCRHERLDPSA